MTKVVGVIAVLALLLTAALSVGLVVANTVDDGSSSATREVRPAPTSAAPTVTDPPTPGLEQFYSQTIDWQPCEGNDSHDCGTLEVPVDYRDPEGETIDLALLRVPADDPIGSLVVNPGGPGAP